MSSFSFTKMHALGNNYIYVNLFEEQLEESKYSDLAIQVSNVYTGIGSDGLILICPSDKAPVKMRIFNNDGSEAMNCGNGLRCVAKYAYERKIVRDKVFTIETLSGLVKAEVFEKDGTVYQVKIDMGAPRLLRNEIPMSGKAEERVISEPFEAQGHQVTITAVSMGNPHVVMNVEEIEKAPLQMIGPIIEKDPRFPEGVNVEFIEKVNDKEFHFRVWERGSGITQACGTGACAAAVAAILNGQAHRGDDIVIHLAGGDLVINWTKNGEVMMTGPAEVICDGVFYYE